MWYTSCMSGLCLRDATRNSILAGEISYAASLRGKTKGLLDDISPRALFFETRWGIHTFGMRFPIDVLVCDRAWRVRAMREALPPKRFFFWNPVLFRVFELPAGTIRERHVAFHDVLAIVPR